MNTETSSRLAAVQWQAVSARDPQFDGRFVFAVKTTGIYCRPSCPARRPKRDNVQFFGSGAEAERAGYRACKRCRPDAAGIIERHLAAIRTACELIDAADSPLRTADLAQQVGMSASHFHRQFKRLLGVTPREYAAGRRVNRLQRALRAGGLVTDAIYEAGYGSGSRAYEAASSTLGMTHGEYRAGAPQRTIEYAIAESPLGWLLVAATDQGVCCIEFGDDREGLRQSLGERFPAANAVERSDALQAWVSRIVASIEAPDQNLELPLHIQGTAFQRRVWRALQAIPRGETASYRDIAEAIGQPDAVRAVANACGANKLAIAIPCHRAVRSDGTLGGYRWGTARKRELLNREQ